MNQQNKVMQIVLKKIIKNSLKNKKNKKTLKTQQEFKSERHNIFIKGVNKIALSSNDDKRIQSITLGKAYAYGTSKNLICNK